MKKFVFQSVALIIVAFVGIALTFNKGSNNLLSNLSPFDNNSSSVTAERIKIKDQVINIEVANTTEERQKGLSGRESLDKDSGMLFTFPEEKKYQFWMKDMKFPIDFIFIRDAEVIDVIRNAPVPKEDEQDGNLPIYEPIESIDMLLEVNAGFVDEANIQVGDKVSLIKD